MASSIDQLTSKINTFTNKAFKLIDEKRFKATQEIADVLPDLILKEIRAGKSPVKGEGRFVDYSEGYKRQIDPKKYNKKKLKDSGLSTSETNYLYKKSGLQATDYVRSLKERYGKRERPVNLTLSGDMLDSLEAKVRGFTVFVRFKSKLAKMHTTEGPGGNKDKIRKLLPQQGEAFSFSIFRALKEILIKNLPGVTKK